MATYDQVSDLPLEIESYELEGLEIRISPQFTRKTTVIRLWGSGEEGVGEDVTYAEGDQTAFQREGAVLPIAGSHTLDAYSKLLDRLSLFPSGPALEQFRPYRRWAFESAALDLALRQAGRSLGDVLGRTPGPVRYVVSLRLAEPPSVEPVQRLIERYAGTRFKLDPTSSWTEQLVAQLVALDAVDTVDFKGAYKGTPVDQEPDPLLYGRVAIAFPHAWLEDPALTEETRPVLEPHRDRITWDAPIHSVGDIRGLEFAPRTLNFKPSRFGSLKNLFDAYDYAEAHGIGIYGGGQFELGPGRGQIQYLASLFHSDAPNDVAPGGFNAPDPPPGLPLSPLEPRPSKTGFRWDAPG
jgi:L-alanine-DL-glutamate epimerase-like enolase superfamily enzyme